MDKLEAEHPNDPKAVRDGVTAFQAGAPAAEGHDRRRSPITSTTLRQVAGVDHVGIGSDFDGIEQTPVGLEDVSTYPKLTAELLRRGWSDDDIKKLLGLNVLRVMKQAEAVAKSLKRKRRRWPRSRPSTAPSRGSRAQMAELESRPVRAELSSAAPARCDGLNRTASMNSSSVASANAR